MKGFKNPTLKKKCNVEIFPCEPLGSPEHFGAFVSVHRIFLSQTPFAASSISSPRPFSPEAAPNEKTLGPRCPACRSSSRMRTLRSAPGHSATDSWEQSVGRAGIGGALNFSQILSITGKQLTRQHCKSAIIQFFSAIFFERGKISHGETVKKKSILIYLKIY